MTKVSRQLSRCSVPPLPADRVDLEHKLSVKLCQSLTEYCNGVVVRRSDVGPTRERLPQKRVALSQESGKTAIVFSLVEVSSLDRVVWSLESNP